MLLVTLKVTEDADNEAKMVLDLGAHATLPLRFSFLNDDSQSYHECMWVIVMGGVRHPLTPQC